MAMPGIISPTIRPDPAPIAGARMEWPESPITISVLCFALALWNGKDPILKERLFGLTNSEGQSRRGRERVLFLPRQHADSFLHEVSLQVSAGGLSLCQTSLRPTQASAANEIEYELLDTGIFDEDRYFDVFIEYAKASPEDILDQDHASTIAGRKRRTLHVLPTLWFRNTWSWWAERVETDARTDRRKQIVGDVIAAPCIRSSANLILSIARRRAAALHGKRDQQRSGFSASANAGPYVKDGINDYIVHGEQGRGEPGEDGNQGGGALPAECRRRERQTVIRLRLTRPNRTLPERIRSANSMP